MRDVDWKCAGMRWSIRRVDVCAPSYVIANREREKVAKKERKRD